MSSEVTGWPVAIFGDVGNFVNFISACRCVAIVSTIAHMRISSALINKAVTTPVIATSLWVSANPVFSSALADERETHLKGTAEQSQWVMGCLRPSQSIDLAFHPCFSL